MAVFCALKTVTFLCTLSLDWCFIVVISDFIFPNTQSFVKVIENPLHSHAVTLAKQVNILKILEFKCELEKCINCAFVLLMLLRVGGFLSGLLVVQDNVRKPDNRWVDVNRLDSTILGCVPL